VGAVLVSQAAMASDAMVMKVRCPMGRGMFSPSSCGCLWW
jgi:hypothetical protein